jgi:hypothetical protein
VQPYFSYNTRKVVRLQQRVAELGVRDPILTFDAPLHRLLGQHRVHGEMLADIAHEFDRAELRQPVSVIDQARRILRVLEIQEASHLLPNTLDVLLDTLGREQLTLSRLAARVTDETGAAANEADRSMARTLQMRQYHDDEQRSDVKTGCSGIESDVARDRLACQRVARAFSGRVDQTAPLELAIHIHQPLLYPQPCLSLAALLSKGRLPQPSVR